MIRSAMILAAITIAARFTRLLVFTLAVAWSTLGIACSSAPASSASSATSDPFEGEPLTTFDGDGGKVHVELRTRPDQPPSRGVENLSLAVTDEAGVPLDGLTIDVVPWMPAMGHGASVKPQVTALGNGHYTVDNVDFVMPGQWQIRITFSGAIEDHAISVLQIP